MQAVINEAEGIAIRSLEARIKRLETMVENLADDMFNDPAETPTGLGISGTQGKRFSL